MVIHSVNPTEETGFFESESSRKYFKESLGEDLVSVERYLSWAKIKLERSTIIGRMIDIRIKGTLIETAERLPSQNWTPGISDAPMNFYCFAIKRGKLFWLYNLPLMKLAMRKTAFQNIILETANLVVWDSCEKKEAPRSTKGLIVDHARFRDMLLGIVEEQEKDRRFLIEANERPL